MLCRKVMGLRAGERIVRITPVEVASVWGEPLSIVDAEDVAAEVFSDWLPAEFVDFFYREYANCNRDTERIEWRYLDATPEWDGTGEKDLLRRGRLTGGMQWPS
jgi:hypothetical protein